MEVKFEAGINIALKIPKNKYEKTVAFYRDILKLQVEEKPITNPTVSRTHEVKFGHNIIWLDCVDNYTHSETWLQLTVPHVEEATKYLESNGVETCDEIEELPENMHWITDPAGTVFNLQEKKIRGKKSRNQPVSAFFMAAEYGAVSYHVLVAS
ncbi:VOC family protein [Chryseobacterium indologenes]|nr:VOC family protein [Chryseobacterium indologenes]